MSVTSRQRPVPPSMFSDETLMELHPEVRLTGLGLRFYVDDHGRGSATPALIRGQLWPLAEEITDETIDEHLDWLEQAGYIEMYEAEGRVYLAMVDWPAVDRPRKSRIPVPPDSPTTPVSPSRAPREHLAVGEREERAREGGSERGGGARANEGAEGAASAVDPSTPFCPKHPSGTYGKCGPCGTARRAHEAWLKQQTDDARTDLDDEDDR